MKTHADIIIVGSGIVGASAAYFLAKKGWKNIAVIEQGNLFKAGGSTSHAPGLVFEMNSSKAMCQLARWSVQTYRELEFEDEPCFYSVGSLEIATTPERLQDLKTKYGRALSWGLNAELIDPVQTRELFPLLNIEKVRGAFYVPEDGIAKALRVVSAMAREVKNVCEFYGNTRVSGFLKERGQIKGVQTSCGNVYSDKVLICGGIWGPQLGDLLGIKIPLIPVQHQYLKTSALLEWKGETREVAYPLLRHQDRSMYFRQHADCIGIGSYSHEPLLVDARNVRAPSEKNDQPASLPFTPEHFQDAFKYACEVLPSLKSVDWGDRFNGMFSFTPDGNPLLGESSQLRGLWLAEGVWVTHAAGVAKVLSEMVSNECPSVDLRELDVNRFWDHSFSPQYVRLRGAQQYREVYDIIHPLQQMENPRPLRTSPFYARMKELGAVFFESAGWERPQWFASNEKLPKEDWPSRSGWNAKYWSPIIGQEHKACREKVALFDLSAFTKLEVKGKDALSCLQKLSTNNLDQDLGKVVYTSMLNAAGGIMCDLTITRWEEDRFWVITGGSVGRHDKAWILQNMSPEATVSVQDITSTYCSLGLWGPQARNLLENLCEEDISNEGFPFYTAKNIYVGSIPCVALRLSYAGELGWELYTPTEYGLTLWDELWRVGSRYGLIAAGGGAFDSLRMEKGYRLWGADIHSEYNPLEAGLGFAVKFSKGDFLGKTKLEEMKQKGLEKKLCCLVLENSECVLLGKEPVLYKGKAVAYVTSANYGYTLSKSIAYAYLPLDLGVVGTELEVLYLGELYKARVVVEPLYDPKSERLKA